MAFATNPDGSTKWIFVQLSGLNGFAVVDFTTQKEINRIKLPDLPPGKATFPVGGNESHGMAVTSDGKTLVVNSRLNSAHCHGCVTPAAAPTDVPSAIAGSLTIKVAPSASELL